jgi:hypothetical protein
LAGAAARSKVLKSIRGDFLLVVSSRSRDFEIEKIYFFEKFPNENQSKLRAVLDE